MKPKYNAGQHVYFIISGRFVTEAVVVAASSGFVTIRFKKNEDCIIRLPYHRIFLTKEEAQKHIRPALPTCTAVSSSQSKESGYVCTRRWELWE